MNPIEIEDSIRALELTGVAFNGNPSFVLAHGSNASQRVGDDWLEYLDSTGNIERYDGLCDCYVCRQIKADYFPWKARKEEAKHLN